MSNSNLTDLQTINQGAKTCLEVYGDTKINSAALLQSLIILAIGEESLTKESEARITELTNKNTQLSETILKLNKPRNKTIYRLLNHNYPKRTVIEIIAIMENKIKNNSRMIESMTSNITKAWSEYRFVNVKNLVYTIKSKMIEKIIANKEYDRIVKHTWEFHSGMYGQYTDTQNMACLYSGDFSFHFDALIPEKLGLKLEMEKTTYNGVSDRTEVNQVEFEAALSRAVATLNN